MDYESQSEKEFQDKIYTNRIIQANISKALDLEFNDCHFEREVEFVNGITSDFIIFDNSNIMRAILECKRTDIGVTEYVRGVGQLFQYEYFQEENIKPKKYDNINFTQNWNINALVIPSSFIKNTDLNIGLFKYPDSAVILEIHESTNRVRCISRDELQKLAEAGENGLKTICQYYVRDNRLFECYIALRVCMLLNQFHKVLNRSEIEHHVLRKFDVINNQNWRNAFITLSSLGFIGRQTQLLPVGINTLNYDIYSFIDEMYSEYLSPYIDTIMDVLIAEKSCSGNINLSNKDIAERIRCNNDGRDVLFLTDSKERYISSWLNIMRDDLGCINFRPRSKERVIQYIPKELNQSARVSKIKEFTASISYVRAFEDKITEVMKEVL